ALEQPDGGSSGDNSDGPPGGIPADDSNGGGGTLIHPYLGPLTVKVDTFRMKETQEEGGKATFDMVFLDAGEEPSPEDGSDTAGDADGSADDAGDGAISDFNDVG